MCVLCILCSTYYVYEYGYSIAIHVNLCSVNNIIVAVSYFSSSRLRILFTLFHIARRTLNSIHLLVFCVCFVVRGFGVYTYNIIIHEDDVWDDTR